MPYIDPNWNIITPRGDVIKQILEPTIEMKPHRLPYDPCLLPGDRFILDKTKYRLVPIKETETETIVEYEVVEK